MGEFIVEYLPDTTSIEREEIVRCRDCKYLEANKYGFKISEYDCGCIYWDADFALGVAPDGFCACGVSK